MFDEKTVRRLPSLCYAVMTFLAIVMVICSVLVKMTLFKVLLTLSELGIGLLTIVVGGSLFLMFMQDSDKLHLGAAACVALTFFFSFLKLMTHLTLFGLLSSLFYLGFFALIAYKCANYGKRDCALMAAGSGLALVVVNGLIGLLAAKVTSVFLIGLLSLTASVITVIVCGAMWYVCREIFERTEA